MKAVRCPWRPDGVFTAAVRCDDLHILLSAYDRDQAISYNRVVFNDQMRGTEGIPIGLHRFDCSACPAETFRHDQRHRGARSWSETKMSAVRTRCGRPAKSGAMKRDEHAHCRLNPLVHDGFAISESSAITEYLEERFAPPQYAPLYPESIKERARVRMVQALNRYSV